MAGRGGGTSGCAARAGAARRCLRQRLPNLNSDASGLTNGYAGSDNTNCGGSGFPIIGLITDCSPAFADAANGDYRLANGRGVDWRVADQHYGPGTTSTPAAKPPSTDHQPVAAFVHSPTAPVTGDAVTFDASSSTCADTPCTYAWVDDGNDGPAGGQWPLGSGRILTFTFHGAGIKYVRLTVTDADGDKATILEPVTVGQS